VFRHRSDVLENIFDPLVTATEKLVREQIDGVRQKTGGPPKVGAWHLTW
jgi:hypothetical protein